MKPIAGLICVALALFGATPARADSSCWFPSELAAYDITMQTLMLAHVAADCEASAKVDPPLRVRLAKFLSQNGRQLDADRDALAQYFHRAYVDDWQEPLNSSLAREEQRVAVQVKENATPEFCEGAASVLDSLATQSWEDYIAHAQAQDWHDRAGLPSCNTDVK